MSAVTLSVPDLLNPLRIKEANEPLASLKLPALQTLLAKSDRFAVQKQNRYQQFGYLFHQPKTSAYAAIMAAAEIEDYDASVFWLRVDPVQMIADRDSLVLIPGDDLAISEEESRALLTAFNQHFEQDKVTLEYASPQHWYLRIAFPVDIHTHPLDSVAYQSVDHRYPTGNAANYWRKLINETQMLFFSHPINEARRALGHSEINSIWIWGEGQLTDEAIVARPTAMVWSEELYLQGLAKLTQSACLASPIHYQAWQSSLKSLVSERRGEKISHHLIQLDSIVKALGQMQQPEWLETLTQLEVQWFMPLLQALKAKKMDSLLLELGGEFRYHITPRCLNRFWRLKRSLATLKSE